VTGRWRPFLITAVFTGMRASELVAQNVARGVKLKSDDGREAKGPLREGVDFPSTKERSTFDAEPMHGAPSVTPSPRWGSATSPCLRLS